MSAVSSSERVDAALDLLTLLRRQLTGRARRTEDAELLEWVGGLEDAITLLKGLCDGYGTVAVEPTLLSPPRGSGVGGRPVGAADIPPAAPTGVGYGWYWPDTIGPQCEACAEDTEARL